MIHDTGVFGRVRDLDHVTRVIRARKCNWLGIMPVSLL